MVFKIGQGYRGNWIDYDWGTGILFRVELFYAPKWVTVAFVSSAVKAELVTRLYRARGVRVSCILMF